MPAELAEQLERLNEALDRLPSREPPSRRYVVPIVVAVLSALPTGMLGAYVGMSVKQAELVRDVAGLRDADDDSRRERGELRSQVQSVVIAVHETKEKLAGTLADVRGHERQLDQHERRITAIEGRRGTSWSMPDPPALLIDFAAPPPTPPLLAAIWGP